jgi:DNA-binding FadR family transcriptional regulator
MTTLPRERIEVKRASQVIAAELRSMILLGELRDDEPLPPEPEFAARLGVSRHHMREALRLLEQDGLVMVRPGRNGGIFLTRPDVDVLKRAVGGILARNGTPLADVMAARLVIEPAAAEIAAGAATDGEIEELEAIIRLQEAEGAYSDGLNSRFHVALTAAAHNQTLLLMMRSLESMIRTTDLCVATPDLRAGSIRAHRAIVRALRARDGARLLSLMRAHLLGFEAELRRNGLDPAAPTVPEVLRAARRQG